MDRDALTKKAIERKLARGAGVSVSALARMRSADEAQADWRGQCRVCHISYTGTITSLKKPCLFCKGEEEAHGQAG